MNNFLEYLYHSALISSDNLEQVTSNASDKLLKNNFYYRYCLKIGQEDINRINELLSDNQEQSFEQLAIENRLISKFDLEVIEIETLDIGANAEELIQAQTIVELGLLTLEQTIEQLEAYKLDSVLESGFIGELGIDLNSGDSFENFTHEYVTIMKNRLSDFDEQTQIGEIEYVDSIFCETLVYQTLINEAGEPEFLTAIVADLDKIKRVASLIYDKVTQNLTVHYDEKSKYDSIDICCEFLNNTNGICTYKFDVELDLDTPMSNDNITIKAPKIRKINYILGGFNLAVCVIPAKDYVLEGVE